MPDLGLSQFQISFDRVGVRSGVWPIPSPRRHFSGSAKARGAPSSSSGLPRSWPPSRPRWRRTGSPASRCSSRCSRRSLLLGCSQGATFPVSAGVFEVWFLPQLGLPCRGCRPWDCPLGAALTPPAHRESHVRDGMAAGAALGKSAGHRVDFDLGLVWAQTRRASIPRSRGGTRGGSVLSVRRRSIARSAPGQLLNILKNRNVLLLAVPIYA